VDDQFAASIVPEYHNPEYLKVTINATGALKKDDFILFE